MSMGTAKLDMIVLVVGNEYISTMMVNLSKVVVCVRRGDHPLCLLRFPVKEHEGETSHETQPAVLYGYHLPKENRYPAG